MLKLVFFDSCDASFRFKEGLGSRNVIYMACTIVFKITAGGNTVSICAINVTKAFSLTKLARSSLFVKLMKRVFH